VMTTDTPRGTHTPGPRETDTNNIVYAAADSRMIVDCSDMGSGELDSERRTANARLIAAAPDLLAELIALEWSPDQVDVEAGGYEAGCPSCDGSQREGHNTGCRLRAAIGAATRGQS